jgi:hypothetical protein
MTDATIPQSRHGLPFMAAPAFFLLGVCGAVLYQAYVEPVAAPFKMDAAQQALARLRPLSTGERTDTYLYLWGDGSINLTVKLRGGTEIRGRGNSVEEAMADMRRQSSAVANALSEK